ncbi:MAG: dihydrolipoyl dehydrogenase [Candidatus Marinimicrobia bacterium]|nr:dihydrolipoyl dehydrogenase [Candidatus Neomarinimicrobiota bacterium]
MERKILHAEVVIIGAGPGGYAAAFRAADLGKQVTLIDKNIALGGVCLNHGCIPSKALLHLAKVIDEARGVSKHGIHFGAPRIDLSEVRNFKSKVVSQLSRGISQMAKARKVNVIHGTASFLSDTKILVSTSDGEIELSFDHAVIATGSSPASIPGLPKDHKHVMTSTEALDLANIPGRLLVIGGGYIGLEMGTVYRALGSSVTIVEFMPNLLPGADQDLVKPLYRKLKKDFENIYLSTKVVSVDSQKNGSLKVSFESGDKAFSEIYDSVLVSVGRRPNSKSLGLENTRISPDNRGFISVNEKQQTCIPTIFAIGDITGDPMLAHKATHEGKVAAEVIAGLPAAFDAKAIPAVIFTDPEIAWAGLTETEAKAKEIPYEKGEFPWAASGRSLAIGRNEGRTKILFDPDTKRVLGIGIVGPNAGDLIGEGVLAIEMGADAEDISLTIHPHPTLTETIANAAEVFAGTITDLYIPPKK